MPIILNQEKKKSVEDYGQDNHECGFRDDSEKIEWEEHYESRNRRWGKEGYEKDDES